MEMHLHGIVARTPGETQYNQNVWIMGPASIFVAADASAIVMGNTNEGNSNWCTVVLGGITDVVVRAQRPANSAAYTFQVWNKATGALLTTNASCGTAAATPVNLSNVDFSLGGTIWNNQNYKGAMAYARFYPSADTGTTMPSDAPAGGALMQYEFETAGSLGNDSSGAARHLTIQGTPTQIPTPGGGGGGAPTAPGVPSFSNITTSSATVSWSAGGSGTTQYRYQVDGGSWLNVGTALTAALSGLSAGTTYTVAVQAGNASNQWSSSSSASFQTNPVGNPGTISITSPSQNQSENVNTFAVQVARTGGSAGPVSVSTVFAPGSATAADASISPATLSWADGNSAVQTITVIINDDSIIESTEYFDVQIANPTGGATLGTSSISIGINDNDAIPTVPNAYINYSQIAAGLNYTVSWSTPPNTTFFKLFRSINSNPFTEIYSGPNTSLLTNSPAGEYFYKVQACNASGCSSDSNTVDILVCGSSGCL
jgi:hypothetical protein